MVSTEPLAAQISTLPITSSRTRRHSHLGGVSPEGFAAARSQSQNFSRFQLDRPDRAVSFSLDSDAPPTETIDALQRLDDLVYQANVLASR